MANLKFIDTQDLWNRVYDEVNGRLKVDIGGANVSVSAGDLRIGAVELQDMTNGNRAVITNTFDLQVVDNAGNILLTSLETLLTAIRDTSGIKKITDPLPSGTNLLGRLQLSDGTLDVPVVNNGTDNAVPIVTDARQEQAEVLAAIATGAGVDTAAFDTLTEGYYSNRLQIECSVATSVKIFYAGASSEFPITEFESIAFSGAELELATLDVPGWAKFAKLNPAGAATLTCDILRSR